MIIIKTLLFVLLNLFRYKNSHDQEQMHRPHVHNVNDRVDDKRNVLKHYENEM